MNGYLTAVEAAEVLGLSPRTVAWYCSLGRIDGAIMRRHRWLIPAPPVVAPAERPRGRPTILGRPMTPAERKRRSRGLRARGGRRAPVYAWAPCDENGVLAAEFKRAASLDAAMRALGPYPFGGMLRRTGHGAVAYNWGFGWKQSPAEAVKLMENI